MADKEVKQAAGKKGKGGVIALVICAIVIVALIGVIIFLLNRGKDDTSDGPKRNVVVTEKNVEKVASNLTEKEPTPIGSYEVRMNSNWEFEDGLSASSNAYVENVETNTNAVYFDIVRADTNEKIYESPILPIGSHLEAITLDKNLEVGNYDCVCTYHLLDEEEQPVSKVSIAVKVNIMN